MPWDFFDGASQNHTCGGDVTLFLNQNHHFHIQMGLSVGTNNYAELMALKLLLHFSLEQRCIKLHIFGDSLIIINWVNKIQHCKNLALITLYEEVNKL